MKNKVSDKLESIFLKLKIKEYTAEEIVSKFSESEFNQLNNGTTIFHEIQNEVDESAFNRSVYFSWLLYLYSILINSGIQTENMSEGKISQVNFMKAIIEFVKNWESLLYKSHVNIDPEIYFKNFELESIKTLDLFLVQSILLDYNIVLQIAKIIKEVDVEVKTQFIDLKQELKSQLENAATFWEETDFGKFKYKRAILNNGNKNNSQFLISEAMLMLLISSVNNIKEINKEILENTLTPDLIREIIELIEFFESYDFKNDTLKRLLDIFPENSALSVRKKKLIIHQILLYFNHSEAMTLIDDEVFLKKENSTFATLEQTKIRHVDRILGI